jgi:hypothetical protein
VEILNYFQTMGTNAILEGFSMNMGNVEMGDPFGRARRVVAAVLPGPETGAIIAAS